MSRAVTVRGLLLACALVIVACGGHAVGAAGAGEQAVPAAQATSVPSGDWPTFDYNSARSGVGPSDTGIDAGNVGRLILRTVQVDGVVDSSAIELHAIRVKGRRHDLMAVTTSYGRTIAIDPGTGAKLWEFVPRGVNSTPGNPQVTTATPVADPDRRYLYAASPNGVIHKLSLASGRQVWSRSVTFDPHHEKIASALNISGRDLVVVTGGYIGDIPPYDGHVVIIDRASGRILHVWNTECSNRHRLILASTCPYTNTQGDNAIWGRGGAVIEPGSRRILVATGNGPFNGRINWGDSVLELTPDATRLLHNWTPPNQAALDQSDTDIGSASPALLPVYHGFHLVVQGAKDGKLHLLNLDRLDGTAGGPAPRLGGEVQEISSPGGAQVLATPAVWRHGGHVFVFVSAGTALVPGKGGSAAYELVGGSRPRLGTVWQDSTPGTSPVVAGGLLYDYNADAGTLLVRQPLTGTVLRSLPAPVGHWNSPIVIGGRIILPTGSYLSSAATSTIDIYHLPGR